jgi:hypothetical protein
MGLDSLFQNTPIITPREKTQLVSKAMLFKIPHRPGFEYQTFYFLVKSVMAF